jgi:hypothetical protein
MESGGPTLEPERLPFRAERWEFGGEFHLPRAGDLAAPAGARLGDLFPGARLFGSGRAALLALLEWGQRERGWRRILIPSYVCCQIPLALEAARVPFARYCDSPDARPAGLPDRVEPGDVVLRLNYFGWRGPEERDRMAEGVDVIEDHTHDPLGPWSRASGAAFALASLRKSVPSPDGAILWSPRNLALPAEREATSSHRAAVELKESGMRQRRLYLEGRPVERQATTALLAAGEAHLGTGEPSGPDPYTRPALEAFDLGSLARARRRAVERLVAAPSFPRAWLSSSPAEGGAPFALVLDLGHRRRRDRVQRALRASRIYTQVLWDIGHDVDARARAFSERALVLACDYRYSEEDLDRVAETLAAIAERESRRDRGFLGRLRAWLRGG